MNEEIAKKLKDNLEKGIVVLVGQKILQVLWEVDLPISKMSAMALRLVAFELEAVCDKIDDPNTSMKELKGFMESDDFIKSCSLEVDRLMADKK